MNKYCTAEVMTLFSSYFPYILILGPTILVAIEKYFSRYIFKKTRNLVLHDKFSLVFKKKSMSDINYRTTAGQMKARQFYRLIVKATMTDEELCKH